MIEKTDETLIFEYQNGAAEALEALFERYKKPVFNFALRILGNRADAEDATSEVMTVLFVKKTSYTSTPGVKFSTWLFTVARNTCISRIRKRKKMISLWFTKNDSGEYEEWDLADPRPQASEELARQEMARKVKKVITELPLDQKEALVLREYHGLSYQEISAVLQCSTDNVKVLIFRARESLRARLASFIMEGQDG